MGMRRILHESRSTGDGVLEYWSIGVLEYWSIGALGNEIVGFAQHWNRRL
jgi:hypothetical protein